MSTRLDAIEIPTREQLAACTEPYLQHARAELVAMLEVSRRRVRLLEQAHDAVVGEIARRAR